MPGDSKTIRRKSVICRKGEARLWQLNRRPGEVDGLALTKDVALHVQEAMQGHLMPYATKGEDGDHATGPRVDFRWLERVVEIGRSSLDTRSQLAQVRPGKEEKGGELRVETIPP